jgi:hypothetical protein
MKILSQNRKQLYGAIDGMVIYVGRIEPYKSWFLLTVRLGERVINEKEQCGIIGAYDKEDAALAALYDLWIHDTAAKVVNHKEAKIEDELRNLETGVKND